MRIIFQKSIVDCEWSAWTGPSKCTKLCGGGDKTGSMMFKRDKNVFENTRGDCNNIFKKHEKCTSFEVCSGNMIRHSYVIVNVKSKLNFYV